MAKHLITGGSGFLGSLIAKRLIEHGEEVAILDIWDDPNRHEGIQFFNGSVLSADSVRLAMQGVDTVHHTAALVPLTKSGKKFWDVNVNGARIVAEEAVKASVKNFIHMSSSAIYGIPDQCPITESTPCHPIEIYGESKLAGENIAFEVSKQSKMSFLSIRPRTILGEGRLGIFNILFDWIQDHKKIFIIGSGDHLFQFVHAHDLMDAYMVALKANKPGFYNVGTNQFSTLKNDLENLFIHANSRSKIVSLPETFAIQTLKVLDKVHLSPLAPWHYLTYHKAFHFDTTPLQNMGWKPKYANIKMLKDSYDWFQENQHAVGVPHASPHKSIVKQKILNVLKMMAG